MEDSLTVNVDALTRHGVEIVRDFADVPLVRTDRHCVMEILVNLISNAKHACDAAPASGTSLKRMTLRIAAVNEWLELAVIDTGVGIAAENLTRIFQHGFTTRAEGHGFGLHSSALTARQLGGDLQAYSDGPGRGATFTLRLPLHHKADT